MSQIILFTPGGLNNILKEKEELIKNLIIIDGILGVLFIILLMAFIYPELTGHTILTQDT